MLDIAVAFITGLTTGGLSCLAVQGGLLASSVAHEVENNVREQPAVPLSGKSRRKQQARVAQTAAGPAGPRTAWPIALFLAAKIVAYTVLGFFLGLLGSLLQLTPTVRAVLQIAIGVFMLGTALRMFNVHPIFRYFALEPPRFVTRYIRRTAKNQSSAVTPLFLGALTVLIPCGVTQAMMAVAMGTGNPVGGAAIMLAFTLGTSPVFFGVAYLASRLGAKLEAGFMRAVAVVVLILGLVSVDAGLTLAGWPYSVANIRMAMSAQTAAAQTPAAAAQTSTEPVPAGSEQTAAPSAVQGAFVQDAVVTIKVGNDGYAPLISRAKADTPLKMVFVTEDTYSCARALVIPALGVQKVLPATGRVTIDLPAQKPGTKLYYSCSMGMYSGLIQFDS